jgi:hypothetical protein
LNLSVQRIDQLAKKLPQTFLVGRIEGIAVPRRATLAHMAVWAVFFLLMAARGGADGRHTGDSVQFWEEACANDLRKGCATLALYEFLYCRDGAGWACNELGSHYVEGVIVEPDPEVSGALFAQACQLGFQTGCRNTSNTAPPVRGDPEIRDLRLLLSQGGLRLTDWSDTELYARACEHGWTFACDRTGG